MNNHLTKINILFELRNSIHNYNLELELLISLALVCLNVA